jgi:hypothetical protein
MRASFRRPDFLVSLVLACVPALALTPAASAGPARAESAGLTQSAEPQQLEDFMRGRNLESVLGVEVRSRSEENMGRIVDVLADRDGQVQAAVIEFGGFLGIGTRKIAVDWSALRFELVKEQPVAVLDMTRDQVRLAPEYRVNRPAVVLRAESS